MSGYNFEVGTRFLINDNEYRVRRELELDFEIENIEYDKIEIRRKKELLDLWYQGLLLFRKNKDEEKYIKIENLNDLSEKEKNEALRRYKILEPVIRGDILPSEINEYLKSMGGSVKKSAFYEWKKRWEKTEDIRALVPLNRGPKGPQIKGDVLRILDDAIEFCLYSDGRTTIEDMFSEFCLRIDEENIVRAENKEETFEYVSRSKVSRRLKEIIDIYRLDKEKYGGVLAKLKKEGSSQEVIATRPLQRVEIDWTTIDVMLIDPVDLKPKRPYLIYAIDKCTGYPLGFYVTFKPVDSNALKQCVLHVIMPKTYLKDLYPMVENEWIAYGKPHTIVVDNASVNDSYEFEDACDQVGVKDVQFCKIDAGYQKGKIERAFRDLNSQLIHNLKGTTFSNIFEKGRYNSEKKACITMQGFIYMVHIALVDMVANSWRRPHGDSPHNRWIQYIEKNPHLKIQIPRSIMSLKIMLMGGSQLRKIQQEGVVIQNEYYFSKELMEYKNLLEKYNREKEDVRVRFDLSDMRMVYVFDQIHNRYIACEGKGFKRKEIDTNLPVPYETLELDSKIKVENKKSFNPSARAISKRKVRMIQEQNEKEIKKWRKGEEPVPTRDSSFITNAVLKTNTEVDIPLDNEDIVLLENVKPLKKKSKNQADTNEEVIFMEYDDTDLEDLPSWGVTKRI